MSPLVLCRAVCVGGFLICEELRWLCSSFARGSLVFLCGYGLVVDSRGLLFGGVGFGLACSFAGSEIIVLFR